MGLPKSGKKWRVRTKVEGEKNQFITETIYVSGMGVFMLGRVKCFTPRTEKAKDHWPG